MQTIYLKRGDSYFPTTKTEMVTVETLPTDSYIVQVTATGDFFLSPIQRAVDTTRIYGDIDKKAVRILSTFLSRPNNTGALFHGDKGSGKSLLARRISYKAAREGIPTIIINNKYSGDDFNSFIASIQQPIVIIFDEFEKVYSRHEDQEALLTLLDGMYESKKLFLFTSNDSRLTGFLLNRPGRIFYKINFSTVEESFIEEYCNSMLGDKSKTGDIIKFSSINGGLSFDILKAIVEELNRYGESVEDAIKMMNIDPVDAKIRFYDAFAKHRETGEVLQLDDSDIRTEVMGEFGVSVLNSDNAGYYIFSPADMISISNGGSVIQYVKGAIELTLVLSDNVTKLPFSKVL